MKVFLNYRHEWRLIQRHMFAFKLNVSQIISYIDRVVPSFDY